MLKIANQRNAIQNHNETSLHPNKNGYYQNPKDKQVLARCGKKETFS